jgi:hypothetical protein
LDAVTNRRGFYEDASRATRQPNDALNPPQVLSELRAIRLNGNSATGQSSTMLYHLTQSPGKPQKIDGKKIDCKFHFQKTKTGWLISGKDL